MLNRKIVIRAALAMVAGLGIASSSWALTATSNVTVTTHVIDSCTITTSTPLAFSAYNPLSGSPLTGSGAVSVTCTKGSNGVTLGMDNGGNYGLATGYLAKRSMAGAVGVDHLAYDLFQPNVVGVGGVTTATAFGTSGLGLFAIPAASFTTGLSGVTVNIFGSIPASQDVTGQSGTGNLYTDTVIATVTF